MPSINYFRDIPNGPNDPSDDQPLMQINTNAVDDIFAVDHYSFGTTGNLDGWHRLSTYPKWPGAPTFPVDPPTLVGQGAVYTKDVGGGVIELFYRRENNGPVIQITQLDKVFNAPTILTGTFLVTAAFTNIVLLPANVYGYIIFFKNTTTSVTQMSSFFTDNTNASGYSTRVVRNGQSVDDPIELDNFSPTLHLRGREDDFGVDTFNFRVHYWNQ